MTDYMTYCIYIFLLAFSALGSSLFFPKKQRWIINFEKKQKLNIFYFITIILISFIVGFRYEVGVDWAGYKLDFESIKNSPNTSYYDQYYEWGFFNLNKLVAGLGFGYQWMFFTTAFISWYFLFKSVPLNILPLFIYFIFVDEYFFWSMNGVRQFAAISIWLFALKFLIDENIKAYIIAIICASLFHNSALLLLPLYFIPFNKLYSRFVWLIIYFVSLFPIFLIDLSRFYIYLELFIINLGQHIAPIDRYVRYVDSDRLAAVETQLGAGFIFKIIVNAIIIWLSLGVIKNYPKLKAYFVLFFMGVVIFNLFFEFQLVNRINNYFIIIRSILLSYTVYHYLKFKNYKFLMKGLMVMYFIIFIASIYNSSNKCCPYQFSF